MLNQKLEEAANKRRYGITVLLLLLLVGGLGTALVYVLTAGGGGLLSKDSVPAEPAAIVTESADILTGAKTPLPAKPPSDEESEKAAVEATARRQFVSLLGWYEADLQPVIDSPGFIAWNADRQHRHTLEKEAAILQFSAGKPIEAVTKLETLMERASQDLASFEQSFTAELSAAQTAYEADQYDAALFAVEKALSFKPGHRTAALLAKKIQDLPEILELVEAARVARIENDLGEELRLSKQVVALDPDRPSFQTRIEQISQILTEQRFETAIASGLQAFAQSDLKALQKAHKTARQIYAGREEVKNLAGKVAALKKKQTFDKFVALATRAAREDRWADARQSFENARALQPDDRDVLQGLDLSAKVLKSQSEITGYLAAPGRLASANITARAEAVLADADLYAALSPSLNDSLEKLRDQVALQNRLVEVTVVSDNLTHIIVRGVGQVGKTFEYKIKLKPGNYLFEGRKAGFKAKIVQVTIGPKDQNIQVKVIPDEPI